MEAAAATPINSIASTVVPIAVAVLVGVAIFAFLRRK